MTLLRVHHDIHNPYVTINNSIHRNAELSFKAKGMYFYAFSCKDDWEFSLQDMARRSKDGIDAVRSGFEELKEAGYVHRVQKRHSDNGQYEGYEYYFFETPKTPEEIEELFPSTEGNSKNVSETGKSHAGKSNEGKSNANKYYVSNKYQKKKECAPSASLRIAEYLFSSIQARDQKARPPNWRRWETDMRRLLELDGRTEADVRQVIDWVAQHEFWSTNILSPASLRRQFTKLWLQMQNENKGPTSAKREEDDRRYRSAQENAVWAKEMAKTTNALKCKDHHVEYRIGSRIGTLSYHEHGFKDQLVNIIQKLE